MTSFITKRMTTDNCLDDLEETGFLKSTETTIPYTQIYFSIEMNIIVTKLI